MLTALFMLPNTIPKNISALNAGQSINLPPQKGLWLECRGQSTNNCQFEVYFLYMYIMTLLDGCILVLLVCCCHAFLWSMLYLGCWTWIMQPLRSPWMTWLLTVDQTSGLGPTRPNTVNSSRLSAPSLPNIWMYIWATG